MSWDQRNALNITLGLGKNPGVWGIFTSLKDWIPKPKGGEVGPGQILGLLWIPRDRLKFAFCTTQANFVEGGRLPKGGVSRGPTPLPQKSVKGEKKKKTAAFFGGAVFVFF